MAAGPKVELRKKSSICSLAEGVSLMSQDPWGQDKLMEIHTARRQIG